MSFSISYVRELYEKTYKEAVAASDYKNYPLAKKKFYETALYLKKLASLDAANAAVYLAKAERISKIADAIVIPAQNAYPQNFAPSGAAAPQAGGYQQTGGFAETPSEGGEDMSQYYTFFPADKLKDGFEGVVGLDEAKRAITEYVINPIKYPDAYNYDFMSSKCILLEGPPGTGKTTFAKAVAKEIEQPFVLVNVASLVNCYVGETGKIIDKVFNSLRDFVAKNDCGITVFFDEFDEIAKSRGGDDKASQTAVPALLRNLDGVTENKNFLILANTNCKDMLDAGVLSRFRRKIYIPLPDAEMRAVFFTKKLSQLEREYFGEIDVTAVSAASEGLSGRTIAQICDDFLHYIGAVKAGLTPKVDLTQKLIDDINKSKMENDQ